MKSSVLYFCLSLAVVFFAIKVFADTPEVATVPKAGGSILASHLH